MRDRLTDEEIKELRALEREATSGPWLFEDTWGPDDGRPYSAIDGLTGHVANVFSPNDARFVMALRNAASALLGEVEKSRKP